MEDIVRRRDPDVQSLERTAAGDQTGFEELVRKYEHPILNTIYRYIGDYSEAEDIAQEVFLKVWRNAGKFEGKSKFSTWLYRIVVNECLNHKTKNKVRPISVGETVERMKTPESLRIESEYERRERAEIVRKAINELPEMQRIALILANYDGHSYKEIARMMGVSLSSVTSLIFRAKDNLRKKLLPLRMRREI